MKKKSLIYAIWVKNKKRKWYEIFKPRYVLEPKYKIDAKKIKK